MYPRSSRFDAAMQDSHTMATLCQVRDLDGSLLFTFNVTDGDVTVADDGQAGRRSADVNMAADTSLVVDELGDLLAPVTNEFYLYRGIEFPDGTTELIQLGVFVAKDFILDDSGAGFQIRLSLEDRTHRLQASPLTQDLVFPSGTVYVNAIQQVVGAVLPNIEYKIVADSNTMGVLIFETAKDRWEICQQLAAAIGCEVFFDIYGALVVRPIPNYAVQPAGWSFVEGSTATVLYFNKRVTDDGFFNHIVVIGEHPEANTPLRVEVGDYDPTSFTYIGGKYGDRAKIIKDSSIKDIAVAGQRAEAELQKGLGFAEITYCSVIVFPVFELGDVVFLSRAKSAINANYTIDKLSIPLTNDRPMYTTFAKRLVQ